jgi:hypothetical protein
MSVYYANVDGEDVTRHCTCWETEEEACIYVADFCKAAHPPDGTGGRMWGKHRYGDVTYLGETKAEYWRAARGNTTSDSEFVKHIGKNVMRVFHTDEYKASREADPLKTTGPLKVGTMREEIAARNRERGLSDE